MKAKLNPVEFMMNSYKNNIEFEYNLSFHIQELNLEKTKVLYFCNAIVNLMKLKGNKNIYLNISENGIDIFNAHTLIVTYHYDLFKTIKNERALKFHFLIEWGNIMNEVNKKQLLIAI